MNNKCIICNNSTDEFTIEHIIPFALGNKNFTLKNVCKKCNSLIGEKIDIHSTNNILAESMRMTKKIPGHSGKVPFPFAKGKTEDGFNIKLSLDMKPTIESKVIKTGNRFRVIASSHDEAIAIAEKTLKRKCKSSLSESDIDYILSKEPKREHPIINYDFEINFNMLKLEAIKIVFETIVYKLGTPCLQDPVVKNLQGIIYKYIYEDFLDTEFLDKNVLSIKTSTSTDICNLLSPEYQETVLHIILFTVIENVTFATVIVEGMLPMTVKLETIDLVKDNSLIVVGYPNGFLVNEL